MFFRIGVVWLALLGTVLKVKLRTYLPYLELLKLRRKIVNVLTAYTIVISLKISMASVLLRSIWDELFSIQPPVLIIYDEAYETSNIYSQFSTIVISLTISMASVCLRSIWNE